MSPAPAGDPGWSRLDHLGADQGGPVDLTVASRIIVVRADNIGDVVSTEPMLRAVRAAVPRARLDLLKLFGRRAGRADDRRGGRRARGVARS